MDPMDWSLSLPPGTPDCRASTSGMGSPRRTPWGPMSMNHAAVLGPSPYGMQAPVDFQTNAAVPTAHFLPTATPSVNLGHESMRPSAGQGSGHQRHVRREQQLPPSGSAAVAVTASATVTGSATATATATTSASAASVAPAPAAAAAPTASAAASAAARHQPQVQQHQVIPPPWGLRAATGGRGEAAELMLGFTDPIAFSDHVSYHLPQNHHHLHHHSLSSALRQNPSRQSGNRACVPGPALSRQARPSTSEGQRQRRLGSPPSHPSHSDALPELNWGSPHPVGSPGTACPLLPSLRSQVQIPLHQNYPAGNLMYATPSPNHSNFNFPVQYTYGLAPTQMLRNDFPPTAGPPITRAPTRSRRVRHESSSSSTNHAHPPRPSQLPRLNMSTPAIDVPGSSRSPAGTASSAAPQSTARSEDSLPLAREAQIRHIMSYSQRIARSALPRHFVAQRTIPKACNGHPLTRELVREFLKEKAVTKDQRDRFMESELLHQLRDVYGRQRKNKWVARNTVLKSLERRSIDSLPSDERRCEICYSEYGVSSPENVTEEPTQFPGCRHHYGDSCLRTWLSQSDSCPTCRTKVPSQPEWFEFEAQRHFRELIYQNQPPASDETEAILAISRGYERGGAQIVASAARSQGAPMLRTIQPRTESGHAPSLSQGDHISSVLEGIPVPSETIGTSANSLNEPMDTAVWDHDPHSEDGSDLYSESDLSDEYPFETELDPDDQMEAFEREHNPGEADQSGLGILTASSEAALMRSPQTSDGPGLAPNSENVTTRLSQPA